MNEVPSGPIMRGTYADLEVRIYGLEEEGYPVEITFSGEQEFPRRHLSPGIPDWDAGSSPAEFGQCLFDWLLADKELQAAWGEGRGQSPLRRVRLRIDPDAAELHTLPWELLHDASPGATAKNLAADSATPFSRYLAVPRRHGRPTLDRPLKMLAAIADPSGLADLGLAELDVEVEKEILQAAASALGGSRLVLTFLPPPVTLAALQAELQNGYHILHLVAHGRVAKDRPLLYLADGDNEVDLVSDGEFAEMLAHMGTALRLVFLATCQSAAASQADAFRGFAPRLIEAGLPAVVAMQDQVPVDTARKFASTFYDRLLTHGCVDLASNEARSTLPTARLSGASIPVLYMRLRDGLLFGRRGQVVGSKTDSFWETLLTVIPRGECTAILGPGVTSELLPGRKQVAQRLAKDRKYPFEDKENLPRVAQYIAELDYHGLRRQVVEALTDGFLRRMGQRPDDERREKGLSASIADADWSRLIQERAEGEIHHQLADLRLPLYVTTNYDSFMVQALQARELNPRQETVAWHEYDQQVEKFDLDPPVDRKEQPVVLHLFGTDKDPMSMVLTVDDYMDYLVRISRDRDYLVPSSVDAALADTNLLFLGYRLEDLEFKVILRGLLADKNLNRFRRLHVAVQLHADEASDQDTAKRIKYFLKRYFGSSHIDVYLGTSQQFMTELHARWQEAGHG